MVVFNDTALCKYFINGWCLPFITILHVRNRCFLVVGFIVHLKNRVMFLKKYFVLKKCKVYVFQN